MTKAGVQMTVVTAEPFIGVSPKSLISLQTEVIQDMGPNLPENL